MEADEFTDLWADEGLLVGTSDAWTSGTAQAAQASRRPVHTVKCKRLFEKKASGEHRHAPCTAVAAHPKKTHTHTHTHIKHTHPGTRGRGCALP